MQLQSHSYVTSYLLNLKANLIQTPDPQTKTWHLYNHNFIPTQPHTNKHNFPHNCISTQSQTHTHTHTSHQNISQPQSHNPIPILLALILLSGHDYMLYCMCCKKNTFSRHVTLMLMTVCTTSSSVANKSQTPTEYFIRISTCAGHGKVLVYCFRYCSETKRDVYFTPLPKPPYYTSLVSLRYNYCWSVHELELLAFSTGTIIWKRRKKSWNP